MATIQEAAKAMYEAFCNYLIDRETEENNPAPKEKSTRPEFLLCDEIWDILDEAGHGTPVLIHHEDRATEVLIYNRYATQLDNVHFMNHIFEELENGCLVTVNGTDIYDLY